MTPYQVKRSVLFYSIQGKILPQIDAEGTGKTLLAENRKRFQNLTPDHQKRVGKGCKPIKEGEPPFEIPESWEWERFGNLVINFDSQRRPVTKSDRKTTKGLYDYYGATGAIDRVDDWIFDGEYLMIGEDGGNFFVDRDNSFIARGRFWANNHVHVVKPIICDIAYLKTCLDAYDLPNMGLINGIAVPKLNQENMNSILIPVPPLAEQKRIVARIEELLPLVDRYEQAWNRLEDLNKRFPGDLQKSLLQLAIQGKLVEQRPEEGTAAELYAQIQREKQALIKAGKLKKEKPLPEITEDEKPFDIPESWKWVRWGTIISIVSARRVHQSDWKSEGIPFYRAREIAKLAENGHVDNELFISKELYNEFSKSGVPQTGDLMVTAVGTLGKTYIVRDGDCFYYKDASIICLENYGHICSEYLRCIMQSEMMMNQIRGNSSGTTVATLTMVRMAEYLLPLPPLEEQKRIVAELELLLLFNEKLEKMEARTVLKKQQKG